VVSALAHTDQTDEVLMARAQDGDANAFGRLYDRHAERAFRIARAICRDRSRAEDAVQEGFLAIWRGRAAYRPDAGSFQAWSMRIVKNRAIDSSRHLAIRPPLQTEDPRGDRPPTPTSTTPQEEVIARSQRDELLDSLRRLPEAQAEVIVLAFYGELSHSEIAERLDLPPGTVKGRMRLGLEKLRREMDTSGLRQTDQDVDSARRPSSPG
jgi:RNA polymerase sigma-70 factor (ECF subfamily)